LEYLLALLKIGTINIVKIILLRKLFSERKENVKINLLKIGEKALIQYVLKLQKWFQLTDAKIRKWDLRKFVILQ
jgi:hypothetical protein